MYNERTCTSTYCRHFLHVERETKESMTCFKKKKKSMTKF